MTPRTVYRYICSLYVLKSFPSQSLFIFFGCVRLYRRWYLHQTRIAACSMPDLGLWLGFFCRRRPSQPTDRYRTMLFGDSKRLICRRTFHWPIDHTVMGAILESRPHIKIAQWYIITDQLSGLGKAISTGCVSGQHFWPKWLLTFDMLINLKVPCEIYVEFSNSVFATPCCDTVHDTQCVYEHVIIWFPRMNSLKLLHRVNFKWRTRSSATADGPRDALRQLKSWNQLKLHVRQSTTSLIQTLDYIKVALMTLNQLILKLIKRKLVTYIITWNSLLTLLARITLHTCLSRLKLCNFTVRSLLNACVTFYS